MEGLGLVDRDGDGVRETPDGRRMAFSILAQSNDPVRIRAAELIGVILRRQGIHAETQVLDFATVQARIFPDQDACRPRAYEMAICGRSAITQLDPDWLRRLFHGDCRIGVNNQAAYRNPECDRLADRQALTTDERERLRLVRRMQEILAEDVPIVTLFYPDLLFAVRPQRYAGWVFPERPGILHKLSLLAR